MSDRVAGFDWDTGNWPKCGKHGVARAAIEEVLRGTPSIQLDRYPVDAETRFDAVRSNADGQRLIRPISARYMHKKEIDHYERQSGKGP